jgi:predicted phosphodiesterase
MRVNVISDLHLEFSDLELPGGDVLILSGDAMEAKNFKKDLYKTPEFVSAHPDLANILVEGNRSDRRIDRYYRFMEEECSKKYAHTIYVMGNHEHYGFQLQKTYPHLLQQLPDNVHLLENETFDVGDITFVGATMWTDCNKGDAHTLYTLKSMMNDYRQITMFNEAKNVYHRLTPERTMEEHYKSRQFITETVEADPAKQYVVVTHHAPTKLSIKPQYEHDTLVNGGYSSDLSEFIVAHPQIKVWTHGHTHDQFDYMVGDTRIICNPRGYKGYEGRAEDFDPTMGFDI